MKLDSLLQKVDEKLASQAAEDVLVQKYDSEISDLAFTCYKNAGAWEDLVQGAQNLVGGGQKFLTENRLGSSIGLGLGGAALGGLLGNQSGSRGEFETEKDFKKRKRNMAITGAIAGGAIGGSIPSVMALIPNASDPSADGRPGFWDMLKHPKTLTAAAGAGGGAYIDSRITARNSTENLQAEAARQAATKSRNASQEYIDSLRSRLDETHVPGEVAALKQQLSKEFKNLESANESIVANAARAESLQNTSSILGEAKFLNKYPKLQSAVRNSINRHTLIPAAGAGVALLAQHLIDKAFWQPASDK